MAKSKEAAKIARRVKKQSTSNGAAGGYLVGPKHSQGGIPVVVKKTGQKVEVEGGEAILTAPAMDDDRPIHEFDGQKGLTKREVASKVNELAGGVSFAKKGMHVPKTIRCTGKKYMFGGEMMADHDIVSSCGCKHSKAKMAKASIGNQNDIMSHGGVITNKKRKYFYFVDTDGYAEEEAKPYHIKNVLPKVSKNDYHISTLAVFDHISLDQYKKIDAEEFISESPATKRSAAGVSKYKVKNGRVYRCSNHWGGVGACIWVYSPYYNQKPFLNEHHIWVKPVDKSMFDEELKAAAKKQSLTEGQAYNKYKNGYLKIDPEKRFKEKDNDVYVICGKCKLSDFERVNKRGVYVFDDFNNPVLKEMQGYKNQSDISYRQRQIDFENNRNEPEFSTGGTINDDLVSDISKIDLPPGYAMYKGKPDQFLHYLQEQATGMTETRDKVHAQGANGGYRGVVRIVGKDLAIRIVESIDAKERDMVIKALKGHAIDPEFRAALKKGVMAGGGEINQNNELLIQHKKDMQNIDTQIDAERLKIKQVKRFALVFAQNTVQRYYFEKPEIVRIVSMICGYEKDITGYHHTLASIAQQYSDDAVKLAGEINQHKHSFSTRSMSYDSTDSIDTSDEKFCDQVSKSIQTVNSINPKESDLWGSIHELSLFIISRLESFVRTCDDLKLVKENILLPMGIEELEINITGSNYNSVIENINNRIDELESEKDTLQQFANGGLIKAKFVRVDEHNTTRKIYKGENGKYYITVDGELHTMTSSGEPDYPVKNVEIVDEFAAGGQIQNQYAGKTPAEIWNLLTHDQKDHFLKDHHLSPRVKSLLLSATEYSDLPAKNFADLPNAIQTEFILHVEQGEYADGGKIYGLLYSVTDSDGKQVLHDATQSEVIEYVNDEFQYDREDAGQSVTDIADAVHELKNGDFTVEEYYNNNRSGTGHKPAFASGGRIGNFDDLPNHIKEEINRITSTVPLIVKRAMLNPVFDFGQLTAEQKKELNKYVKKGILDKGKGGPFPFLKTGYALHGFDFVKDREVELKQMFEEIERLEPGTIKIMAKGGTIDTDTILLPRIIAEGAVWDAFEKEPKLKGATPQKLFDLQVKIVPYLEEKAATLYKNSKSFNKNVNASGSKGRDYLWAMMEHWTKGWLHDNKQELSANKLKQGGRIKSAINRDRKYKSGQKHEQTYKRKTKPANPTYAKRSAKEILKHMKGGGTIKTQKSVADADVKSSQVQYKKKASGSK